MHSFSPQNFTFRKQQVFRDRQMTQNENQVFIIEQQNNTESNFGSVSILAFNVPEFCT